MMVGRDVVLEVEKREKTPGRIILETRKLCATNPNRNLRLKNIDLFVREGEIVGVAGVEGNGQVELEEVLMGLRKADSGSIWLESENITDTSTSIRRRRGMVYIPSDRSGRGLLGSRSIKNNLLLGLEWRAPFSRRGVLFGSAVEAHGRKVIDVFDIHSPGIDARVDSLSGGNQQKVVIGRELSQNPKFIIAAQPIRGVDVGAVEYIHRILLDLREQNRGILLISTELDELMALCDRIYVLYEGRFISSGTDFTEEELGLLIACQKNA